MRIVFKDSILHNSVRKFIVTVRITYLYIDSVQMSQLRVDVLEKSLLKSFVIWYRHCRKSLSRADIATLRTLMSVCRDWRCRVKSRLSQLKALVVEGRDLSISVFQMHRYLTTAYHICLA